MDFSTKDSDTPNLLARLLRVGTEPATVLPWGDNNLFAAALSLQSKNSAPKFLKCVIYSNYLRLNLICSVLISCFDWVEKTAISDILFFYVIVAVALENIQKAWLTGLLK